MIDGSLSRTRCKWLAWIACLLLVTLWMGGALSPARADDEPEQPPAAPADNKASGKSLDDALLDDLDNELLEGAGNIKDRAGPKPGGAPRTGEPAGETEMIDDGDTSLEDTDPLSRISHDMRSVEELIPKASERPYAEQLQQQIVDELAALIEQAEQQRAQQQSSSSKSRKERTLNERKSVQQPKQAEGNSGQDSNKPASDSTDRLGKADAARPSPELLKGLMKDSWGHLPPKAREQMLQNTPDKFLPQYELMIEKYYKRLAEDDGR